MPMTATPKPKNLSNILIPKRFFLLDILRGFASLAVVVWHYQHFCFISPGQLPEDFNRQSQPFYEYLSLFYTSGGKAVELFFVLSGFIFFWLYQEKLSSKTTTAREFFLLRFSRLYPLHFLTLIIVAIAQAIFFHLNGQYVVYPYNDIQHFLLNIFFASHWGFQNGWSFNAPVWSVSIEVLLYTVFFVYASLRIHSFVSVILMMLMGIVTLRYSGNSELGLGIFCFFAGGGAYYTYEKIVFSRYAEAHILTFIVLLLLLIVLSASLSRITSGFYSSVALFGGVFPSLVLFLAILQTAVHDLGQRFRIIGDITYSTYLLHFPMQLLIIGCTVYLGVKIDYESKEFFVLFFASLVLCSVFVYHYFELPAQRYLRNKFLVKRLVSSNDKNVVLKRLE